MERVFGLLIALALLVSGCTIVNRPQPPDYEQTQLERRQYQQRDFDTNDTKLVMKAVLNTLQDDGFTVRNAVVDLGLISAVKEIMLTNRMRTGQERTPAETWAEIFAAAISRGRAQPSTPQQPQRYRNIEQIEATVNVSPFGTRQTRVRVSFVARILDNEGAVIESYPVTDPNVYQQFFLKVDKGVFLEKQKF
ncbi:MAG: hypothetical protein RML15_05835 [Bacteroidota bacterium]|nr:hypothetical protein [Candidatus Kapabacteria bacterium]MCS7302332.1 hypothetical protein [Candidatus Kapabacteria bacterium]MCX7936923.1 hypothetical protein [Chlorobiota bacterium]MDW8075298.1 hypothetical protein [Bacteroidota bacterium]MDW8271910.1 hypothetical protein [Bacteroidota bacterium]